MAALVLTMIGDDRPGLVSAVSGVVRAHGASWEQSQMARLGGKFAGILLVDVTDDRVDALTAGLARLLDDAALRARMGAAGRAEAEGLGWRAATEFLVASYEEAVRRHRSRRPPPRHPRG